MRRRGSTTCRAYGLPLVLRAVRGECFPLRRRVRCFTSLAACGLACMLLPTITPELSAQQFTGGLRGAVKEIGRASCRERV